MKRDNRKTIRNKKIKEYTAKLKELQPEILNETGFKNVLSLHGFIGGKNKHILNLEKEYIFLKNILFQNG
ncbi:MAG: hypothetical protein WC123_04435 [Bacilli bacterium]|jgi:hypothetical protein